MPDWDAVYPFVVTFGLLIGAGVGLPIPEELPIIGAGIWVGHNPEVGLYRWLMLPFCIVTVVLSDSLLYCIGRFGGAKLLEHRWMQRLIPPAKRQRIEENFHKHGVMALLFARFLPAIRSPIFITAGIMRLSLLKFMLADGIYAIPGVSLLFFLSYWFGDHFRELFEENVEKVRPIIVLVAISGVGVYMLYRFLRRPVATGDPQELPVIGEKMASTIEHAHHSAESEPGNSQPQASDRDGARVESGSGEHPPTEGAAGQNQGPDGTHPH